MPVGFECYNDSGFLQITTEQKCFVLTHYGTLTVSSGTAVVTLPLVDGHMMFIEEGHGILIGDYVTGSDVQYTIYAYPGITEIRYYRYAIIQGVVGSGGLVLYNDLGQATFDANQRPLIPYTTGSNVGYGTAISFPATIGRKYAIYLAGFPVHAVFSYDEPDIGWIYDLFIPKHTRSGGIIVFNDYSYVQVPGSFWNRPNTNFIVVDITDLSAELSGSPPPPPGPPPPTFSITKVGDV